MSKLKNADIGRLLQRFKNIGKSFKNISVILPYFNRIFLQYFRDISLLCEHFLLLNYTLFYILG